MRRTTYILLLLATCLVTRVFYFGFVWADEGLWFTVAQEMLRGKTLYREIWFDKPPALAAIFEGLFSLPINQLLAVRWFTVLYAFAVALMLWRMAAYFWPAPESGGPRITRWSEGRMAALFYAFYNATYIHSQVQPLAGDHLVLIPYLGSVWLYLMDRCVWGGVAASLAFQINPKVAVIALVFVFIEALRLDPRGWFQRMARFTAGFMAGSLPWLWYLTSNGKWDAYVEDFWGWGFRYVGVYSVGEWFSRGGLRTLNYLGFHAALAMGVILLFRYAGSGETRERFHSHVLLAWLGASYLGVAGGGRFYPRYFYLVLPLICLLAARGFRLALDAPASRAWRTAAAIVVAASLCVSLIRFHSRTVVLAFQAVTGRQTSYISNWDDTALDRDSRALASNIVAHGDPHATLFVWGYRPEIYFYCGCRPVSEFLSSQPLTGVPADIQLTQSRSAAPIEAARNRMKLALELHAFRPEFIVDGLGAYNPALAMEQYPELLEVLARFYRRDRLEIGHGWIYRRLSPAETLPPIIASLSMTTRHGSVHRFGPEERFQHLPNLTNGAGHNNLPVSAIIDAVMP